MPHQLAIFPLPGLVLFPRTHLPLHFFEPRYRAMMDSVMAGEKKLAVACIREGAESDYFGTPPLHRVMTAARVLMADKISGGRWNTVIEGIERVELLEEIQSEPFRIGRVESIPEAIDEERREQIFSLARDVARVAESLGGTSETFRRLLTNMENTHKHPAIIADIVSALLVRDAYARQSLLSERDILRRLQLLQIQLRTLVLERGHDGLRVDSAQGQ